MAAFSRSIELIHSPPDLITSFERSVITTEPSVSILQTSPVMNQSSSRNWLWPSPFM